MSGPVVVNNPPAGPGPGPVVDNTASLIIGIIVVVIVLVVIWWLFFSGGGAAPAPSPGGGGGINVPSITRPSVSVPKSS